MSAFDVAILQRLRSDRGNVSSGASREVLALVKSGRSLDNAIVDVIESMPWNETVRLRRWARQAVAFAEWISYERVGWRAKRTNRFTKGSIEVVAPGQLEPERWPSLSVIAAAVDVECVHQVGIFGHDGRTRVYEATRKCDDE